MKGLSYRQLGELIGQKRAELAAIFNGAKGDGGEYTLTAEQVADVRARNAELKDLGERFDELKDIEEIRRANDDEGDRAERDGFKAGRGREIVPNGDGSRKGPIQAGTRQIGAILRESKAYLAFQSGAARTAEIELTHDEMKTLLTLGDITPQAGRSPDIVPYANAFRPISDLFAQGTINSNTYEYYEMTTWTNNAAETAEGGTKPESAIDFTLRTDTMRKIATWLPATYETLADNEGMESLIKEVLADMVVRRREAQLMNGDGTAPNISGITDRSGIQTQAKGADPVFDALLKAMTKVRVTGDAEPTGIVMHPNDWQDLVLTRTADGLYILGNPGDPMVGSRLWGAQVRAVPAQTENTAVVGAFKPYAQIFRKPNGAIRIVVSTEHSTYFVENKVAILAEERLLLAVYRPAAFCTVTGI